MYHVPCSNGSPIWLGSHDHVGSPEVHRQIHDLAQDWLGGVRELHLSLATDPIPLEQLNPDEKRRLSDMRSPRATECWLLGRRALAGVLSPRDRAAVSFPDPETSLSHTDGLAAAIRLPGAHGVGIDVQDERQLSPGLRLRIQVRDLCEWTIKEAVFKANPGNGGTVLSHYTRISGEVWACGSERFRALSVGMPGYRMAIAVRIPDRGWREDV